MLVGEAWDTSPLIPIQPVETQIVLHFDIVVLTSVQSFK
jgi:hypothetical protein